MSIEINNIQSQASRERTTARSDSQASSSRSAAVERSSASSDQVRISVTASQLSDAQGDAFDVARVDAIREAIAEGTYHVDPERLADNFIQLEQQLVG